MIPAVNASTRDTFLASLGRCRATAGFLDAFYQRFVASSDEVRAKFAKTDMMRQVRVLEDTLFVVANAVQGEEGSPARSDLPRIAERHSRRDLDIRPGALRPLPGVPDRDGADARSEIHARGRGRVARGDGLRHRLHAEALLASCARSAEPGWPSAGCLLVLAVLGSGIANGAGAGARAFTGVRLFDGTGRVVRQRDARRARRPHRGGRHRRRGAEGRRARRPRRPLRDARARERARPRRRDAAACARAGALQPRERARAAAALRALRRHHRHEPRRRPRRGLPRARRAGRADARPRAAPRGRPRRRRDDAGRGARRRSRRSPR